MLEEICSCYRCTTRLDGRRQYVAVTLRSQPQSQLTVHTALLWHCLRRSAHKQQNAWGNAVNCGMVNLDSVNGEFGCVRYRMHTSPWRLSYSQTKCLKRFAHVTAVQQDWMVGDKNEYVVVTLRSQPQSQLPVHTALLWHCLRRSAHGNNRTHGAMLWRSLL